MTAQASGMPATALVTGASRGIGRAIARRLCDGGTRVALSARDADALTELAAELPGAQVLPADLADASAADALVDRAIDRLGTLDALVCAAGVVRYQATGDVSRADLEEQLAVNLVAPFMLAQRAAAHMAGRGGGAIVCVASTLALKPAPMTLAYAAAKAALVSMTRTMAVELGPANVRVNAIAPGVVDTEMVRQPRPVSGEPAPTGAAAEARVEAQLEALRRLHLLGRLGTPDEVADAALYLLGASFVTGEVLVVDGGLLLGG